MRLIKLLLAAVLALVAHATIAQPYPNHALKIVVAFVPGGAADSLARPIAERLGAVLGQSVVVENKPGGNTLVAGEYVARSPPDGYTLYLTSGSHVLTPFLMKNVPYDPVADFTPIALLSTQPFLIFANAQQPYATLKEMVAYAQANPGKLSIGVSDAATIAVAQALRGAASVTVEMIPYKGFGQQVTDLLSGQLPVGVGTPSGYKPFAKEEPKRVRALAITGPQRLPYLPDVPTVGEQLGLKDFDVQTWYALVGPARLPRPIVERLHAEIAKILGQPDMQQLIESFGMVVPANTSPEAAGAIIGGYPAKVGKLLQSAGVKPE